MKNQINKSLVLIIFLIISGILFPACKNPFWPDRHNADEEKIDNKNFDDDEGGSGTGGGSGGNFGGGGGGGSGWGGGVVYDDSLQPNYFLVTFDADGGDPTPDEQKILPGGTVMRVQPPVKIVSGFAYGFGGWSADGINAWDFSQPVTSNLNLKAIWGTSAFTVTFHSDNGIPEPPDQSIIAGGKISTPNPMTRGTDAFDGWYTEPGFINKWNFTVNTLAAPGADMDLYARWVPGAGNITVNFVANNGIPNPEPQILTPGTTVTEPNISREGYAFGGWFEDSLFSRLWNFAAGVSGNITLYAKWAINENPVHFHTSDGSPVATSQLVAYGGEVVPPSDPEIVGYKFFGWFYDPAFNVPWNFYTDTVTEPLTLYAGFSIEMYSILYFLEIGELDPIGSDWVPYGSTLNPPSLPNRPGKAFSYWYDWQEWYNQDHSLSYPPPRFDLTGVNSGHLLYGYWEDRNPNTREVNFYNAFGGSIVETVTVMKDTKVAELSPRLTKPGYGFAGWYRNDTLALWDFDSPVNDDLDLHPRWVPQGTPYVPGGDTDLDNDKSKPGLVWVPPGSFMMGDGKSDAGPVHKVELSGFYIADVQVTQIEYVRVMTYPAPLDSTLIKQNNPSNFRKDIDSIRRNHPVERVSWYDAVNYCILKTEQHNSDPANAGNQLDQVYTMSSVVWSSAALSGTDGMLKSIISATVNADFTKSGYRLPTEAEWEYAARGGNGSPGDYIYSGGNTASMVAWYNDSLAQNGTPGITQPVGTKQKNGLGISDMSGNVMEWCWDWYGSTYYSYSPLTDPKGPGEGLPGYGTERVRRGGAWGNAVDKVRSVVRASFPPDNHSYVMGIRVVRGLAPSELPQP